MSRVPADMMAFDVERGLAKALGIRVETLLCGPKEFKFRIGQRWQLVVDHEQIESLWDDCDQPSTMKSAFDNLKADCLGFMSFQR
tara:strand:+ start:9507 stop:9761 length:255 start_codon:yes stop_codon:yes gene_type:complete